MYTHLEQWKQALCAVVAFQIICVADTTSENYEETEETEYVQEQTSAGYVQEKTSGGTTENFEETEDFQEQSSAGKQTFLCFSILD